MLRLACIAVLIGAALLSGCMVASTYPLYATGDPTKVPGLAGNWTTSDGKTWLGFFDPMSEDEDFMTLAMRGEDGHTSYFKVHPVIIRETQLLDIEPAPEPGQSELLATLASYHWIVQAEFTATDEWTLRVLDPQKTWTTSRRIPAWRTSTPGWTTKARRRS